MTGVSRLYHGISNLVTRINDILKRNVSFCCNFQNSLVRKTSWFVLKYLSWLSPAWMEKVPLPMKNGCCKNGRKCLWVSLKEKKKQLQISLVLLKNTPSFVTCKISGSPQRNPEVWLGLQAAIWLPCWFERTSSPSASPPDVKGGS